MEVKQPAADQQWKRVRLARTHELVIEAIEEQILAGSLKVGDALPPERELAARLGVSRAGVREAVRVLESQGALRSRVGSGAEAGTFVAALPRQALTRMLQLHVALSSFAVDDVVDARIVLERASAERAAGRRGEGGLAAMRDALTRMDDPAVTREQFNDADTDFHLAIAEASGNEVSAALTVAIRASLRGPILQSARRSSRWDDIAATLCREHHALHAAIVDGDPARAAELAEQHIRGAAAALALTPPHPLRGVI